MEAAVACRDGRKSSQPAARKIADYACDPDETLTPDKAELGADRVGGVQAPRCTASGACLKRKRRSHDRELARYAAEFAAMSNQMAGNQAQLSGAQTQLVDTQAQLAEARRQLAEAACQQAQLARQFAELPWEQIRQLGDMGPWSFGAARSLKRWSRRLPHLAGGFKSLAGFRRVL